MDDGNSCRPIATTEPTQELGMASSGQIDVVLPQYKAE